MEKPKETTLKPIESIDKIVEKLANKTYEEIASSYAEHFGNNPNEIFYQNACQQFSEIMKRKLLTEQGIKSNYKKVNITSLVSRGKQHIFLVLEDGYIVDGTWQQFLDEPQKNNHCLVLNNNFLKNDLSRASVPRKLWFIYGVHSIKQRKAA